MNNSHSPKTLHLLIKANWLVDSITSLGGGYMIHLAYQISEIDPEVLKDIKSHKVWRRSFGRGYPLTTEG